MSFTSRIAPRLRSLRPMTPSPARSFTATTMARKTEEWPQAFPVGKFYESMVNDPIPYPFQEKPEEPPNSAAPEVLPEGKSPVSAEASASSEEAPAGTKKKPGRKPKNATVSNSSAETSTTTAASSSTTSSTPPPSSSTTSPSSSPGPPPSSAEERARIVFGTRLAGPGDEVARISLKKNKSTLVAGVLVPPEPEEPDNCCMSGCVNCVWELYREDMEEFAAKKSEAERRLILESKGSGNAGGEADEPTTVGATEDHKKGSLGVGDAPPVPDGVDIADNKISKNMWEEEAFKNVPVGIREFMKQEKRLKERHEREALAAGGGGG